MFLGGEDIAFGGIPLELTGARKERSWNSGEMIGSMGLRLLGTGTRGLGSVANFVVQYIVNSLTTYVPLTSKDNSPYQLPSLCM